MADKLYEYAVVYHPKTKKDEPPKRSEVVKPPTTVLAKDEKEVGIKAAREIPDAYLDCLDQVEILIRPF